MWWRLRKWRRDVKRLQREAAAARRDPDPTVRAMQQVADDIDRRMEDEIINGKQS